VAYLNTECAALLMTPVWSTMSLWAALLAKTAVVSGIYWLILLLMERDELWRGWQMVWGLVGPHWRGRIGRLK
jgi:hypothetical protein